MIPRDPLLEDEDLRRRFPNVPEPLDAVEDDDVFALVDGMEQCDGMPLPPAEHLDMLTVSPVGVPAPQEAFVGHSKDIHLMGKIRARNRESQAKYRQKMQVCSSHTFNSTCTCQEFLQSALLSHLVRKL